MIDVRDTIGYLAVLYPQGKVAFPSEPIPPHMHVRPLIVPAGIVPGQNGIYILIIELAILYKETG